MRIRILSGSKNVVGFGLPIIFYTSFRMSSTIKFYKCEEIFGELPLWKSVPETERKEIFNDVLHNLGKKEKEQAKVKKYDFFHL